jgi:excisionase family DNA binding protein
MPREFYSASEAARTLGISLDTLRRWDSKGRIKTRRDPSNRRIVPSIT